MCMHLDSLRVADRSKAVTVREVLLWCLKQVVLSYIVLQVLLFVQLELSRERKIDSVFQPFQQYI